MISGGKPGGKTQLATACLSLPQLVWVAFCHFKAAAAITAFAGYPW